MTNKKQMPKIDVTPRSNCTIFDNAADLFIGPAWSDDDLIKYIKGQSRKNVKR